MKIYDKKGKEKKLEFLKFYKNNDMYFSIYKIYDYPPLNIWTEIMVAENESLEEVLKYYGYFLKGGD